MRKTYTFFILHRYLFDGYWALPIISYLSLKNKVNLIFLYNNGYKNFKELLPKKNLRIYNLENYTKKFYFLNLILKVFNKISKLNFEIIDFIIFNIIKNTDVVYLSYVRNQKKFDLRRIKILNSSKKLNKLVYFFPPVSSDMLFSIPKNSIANRIFVTTKSQMNYLKEKNINSEVVGAPNLSPRFINNNILKYKKKFKISPRKKTILFILKNENANIFKYIDFEALTIFTLNELSKLNLPVLIKPHPQQNFSKLIFLIKKSKLKNFKITNHPIIVLSNISSKVITQYSGGILDILSSGKVPFLFWPVNKFMKKNKKSNFSKNLKKVIGNKLSDAIQYKDFSIKINNVKELLAKNKDIQQKKFKFKERYIKKLNYKIFN